MLLIIILKVDFYFLFNFKFFLMRLFLKFTSDFSIKILNGTRFFFSQDNAAGRPDSFVYKYRMLGQKLGYVKDKN